MDLILAAKTDDIALNKVIAEYKNFILGCCSNFCNRFIDTSDNEFSVAQYAFSKAVKSYDINKNIAFNKYAFYVIRNALIDDVRKNSNDEIVVSPFDFEGNYDENRENISYSVEKSVAENSAIAFTSMDLKYEIEAIDRVLAEYQISFFNLAECSPKAKKTKEKCAVAIRCILDNEELFKKMRSSKTLPLKNIEEISKVPRKILERHRKYIIAAVEIISGDYPYLADYLRYITRKDQGII